jgi:ribulose bisphosphate carboxylase small subunit
MKLLNVIASMFLNDHSDPYIRIAEVEHGREFRRFVKTFGRRPTTEEAKYMIQG